MAAGGRGVSGNVSRHVNREMGYTVEEFAAVLPAAMRDWSVIGGPSDWRVKLANGEEVARIQVSSQPQRRLGALSLPVLAVCIEPTTASAALVAEFMQRFERGFHRGGG